MGIEKRNRVKNDNLVLTNTHELQKVCGAAKREKRAGSGSSFLPSSSKTDSLPGQKERPKETE